MTYRTFMKCSRVLVLVPVCLALFLVDMAFGTSYYLKTDVKVVPAHTLDNPTPVTMWGFAKCDATFANCSSVQVPGPTLTATAGQPLSITINNALSGPYTEPVSVVVPGQIKAMNPVWINYSGSSYGQVTSTGFRAAGDVRSRVRSFDTETPVGQTVTYTWPAVKEGTFLYESGTHPSVQIQMGLYGALVVYPSGGAGTAYGNSYDSEAVLLYSEIDPRLHDAIAAGNYGPTPPAQFSISDPRDPGVVTDASGNIWMTSTAEYHPKYFLINGSPYSGNSPAIPAGKLGQKVLLRFLNAGLATKVPTLQDTFNIVQNGYMTLLAEDGYPYTWKKQQYGILLPAGKTTDAMITTTATVGATTSPGANIAIYDRRFNLANGSTAPGGQLAFLNVGGVPAITALPTFVNLGSVQLYTPVQEIVTVKNNGLSPLTLSYSITGTDAAMFTSGWSATLSTIQPGESGSITVGIVPTTAGTKSATLHIISNDPNQGTIDIPMSAVGI